MRQGQRGNVNWTVLAALAASVTALAAVVTAVMIFWYVRQETQRVLLHTALDSLWHLDAEWNSDDMLDARSAAAAALLEGRPAPDIDAAPSLLAARTFRTTCSTWATTRCCARR